MRKLKRNFQKRVSKSVTSKNYLPGRVGEALRVEVEVLFTVIVDKLVETVMEVAFCVLGFILAVEVEGVVVVTNLEVTEVEEEEVAAGLEWPVVDVGKVVLEAIVENVLATEELVREEMVKKEDVACVLGLIGMKAEVVEPLTAVADGLGTADMAAVVGVSAMVVVVLTSIGLLPDVVKPLLVLVSILDSLKIVAGVEMEEVIGVV